MSDGDGDNTPEKHRGLKDAWRPGQSGNPAGRPKGSRNKYGEDFVQAFYEDFLEGGTAAIKRVRTEDPSAYLRAAVAILPKEVQVTTPERELTDEQLDARIRQLAALLEITTPEGSSGEGPARQTH